MQAVAAFFASIITFVSGFFAPTVASNSPVDVRTTQPAAVVAAQTVIAGNPFNDAAAASAVAAAIPATVPASAFSPPPAQTVINQPVIERIIERIVPQGGTISAETLAAILADFEQSISNRLAALNPPPAAIPAQVAAGGNAGSYTFSPASQRIDQITNTAINTPTITGGSISGASVTGYLPLSGGTLTGTLSGTDLNLSGVLTAGTLNVGGLSSSGALFAPYFSATSTTATSSFAGGLTAANGNFSILQNGNVGIGTAAPSIAGVNSNSRVLSIVGDGTLVNARGVLELANPRASGSLAANDTAGSAFFVMSNNSGSPYIAGVLGSLSGSGGANGFGGKLQFQTKSDNNTSSATTKMVLDQNGNIGIGTTTPWGKLSITGSGTGTGLAFAVADSANTPRFVIQDNGNVGIGTTNPSTLFSLNGNASNAYPLSWTNNGTGFAYADSAGAGITNANPYTSGSLVYLTGNNVQFYNGSSVGATISAGTLALAGTSGTTTLATGQGFTIGGSQFVLQQGSGNVGIGTTSPANPLHIVGSNPVRIDSSTDGASLLLLRGTGAITQQNIAVQFEDTASVAKSFAQIRFLPTDRTAGSEDADLAFFLRNAGSLNEAVRITGAGNVGIGTTSPTNKLEIAGNTFLGGTITGTSTLALTGTTGTSTIASGQGFTIGGSQFVVQQGSGNVGIGTTGPNNRLEVSGGGLRVGGAASATATGVGAEIEWDGTVANFQGFNRAGAAWSPVAVKGSYMQLLTQGTERVRIDTSGNVGIGTTSPSTLLGMQGGIGVSPSHLYLAGNGTVGIGTTGPGAPLDVRGATGGYTLFAGDTTNAFFAGSLADGAYLGNKGTADLITLMNGVEKMRVANSGNVGIGTTTPGYKLEVRGSGDVFALGGSAAVTHKLGFDGSGNPYIDFINTNKGIFRTGGTDRMVIDSSGNVGIGATTPTYKLTIAGTNTAGPGSSAQLAVGDGGDGNVGKMLQIGYNTTDDYGWMQPVHWGNGYKNLVLNQNGGNVGIGTTSPQSKLHIANGFSGAVPLSGTDLTVERSTGGYVSLLGPGTGDNGILFGNPTSNADGGIIYDPVSTPRGLQFRTGGNQTRLTINSSGNVGIGTTNPGTKFDVEGASIPATIGSSDNTFVLNLKGNGDSTGAYLGSNAGALLFANSGGVENMRISSTGNVGIGTTTPGALLSAQGNILGAGTLALTGTTGTTTIAAGQGFTIGGSQFILQQGSGNVGIGASSPGARLHSNVSSSNAQATALLLQNDAANTAGGVDIDFKSSDTIVGRISSITGAQSNFGRLAFYTKSSGSLTERMRIDMEGNVGIGTTAPGGKLDVAGPTFLGEIASGNNGRTYVDNNGGARFLQYDNSGAIATFFHSNGNNYINGGNVGIGTTTPATTFSTAGNGYFTGGLGVGLLNTTAGTLQTSGNARIGGDTLTLGSNALTVSQSGFSVAVPQLLVSGVAAIGGVSPIGTVGLNVGAPSASSNALVVSAASGATADIFQVYGSGSSLKLNVTASGNVGIGTTTPNAQLAINTGVTEAMRLSGLTAGRGIFADNGASSGIFSLTRQDTVATGDLSIAAFGGIGFKGGSTAYNNAVSSGYAMYLNSSGNVGIGTTSPSSLLHLSSTGNAVLTIDGGVASAARLDFKQGGTSYGIVDFDGNNFNVGNLYLNGATILKAGNAEQMRITSTGNVGIGTTSPDALLSVSGSMTLTDSAAGTRSITRGWVNDGVLVFAGGSSASNGANIELYGGTHATLANNMVLDADVLRIRSQAGADRLRVDSSGNVGIGTTSPSVKLHLYGTNVSQFIDASANSQASLYLVGDNTPKAAFYKPSGSNDARLWLASGGDVISLQSGTGNVGIGTTTPTAQLSTTGTVRFSNFGAGTLTTDASGNLSVSSDERLKNIDGAFSRGLADVLKLSPIRYHWNPLSGLDQTTQYAGFSAQNVQQAIPEAVGSSTSGYLTLQDRPLIAAAINAIKELATKLDTFAERFTTKQLTFVRGEADDLTLNNKLCIKNSGGTAVCVTGDQLAALLSQAAAANLPPSVIPSATTGLPISVISQAPIIELNGNASSTIELGDTYNDLGARIVTPAEDANLGIVTVLDGATTTAVSIDTTQPGEHTILYSVTSPTTGLTGSAMRTVIVSPATQSSEPPANDNPFNAPPANDNVSTSTLLNTEPAAVNL